MKHEKINYVEYPAYNLAATKQFFTDVFEWMFTDYGSEYTAFTNAGINGGFYQSNLKAAANDGSALVVFYSHSLELTQQKVEMAGGVISTAIFNFPGGRRFHFIEPSGNEFAVWSDA